MLVQISHEKPYGKRFDVYCGDRKLESGEEYDIPASGALLRFVERNPAVGKGWVWLLLVTLLAGVIGAPDDLQSIRRYRTEICVRLGAVADGEIFIRFTQGGQSYTIEGAAEAEELFRREEPLPQVERRIRGYQIGVIVLVLALLAAMIAACCLAL